MLKIGRGGSNRDPLAELDGPKHEFGHVQRADDGGGREERCEI